MSDDNKIKRNIAKKSHELEREIKSSSRRLKRHTYLISDSKGSSIKRVLLPIERFHIIHKSGARSGDTEFLEQVKKEISDKHKPILIIWFGTCEITLKKDRLLEIREPPHTNVRERIEDSKKFRDEILKLKPEAKIVFLECPYYSIKKFNSNKKEVKSILASASGRDENNNRTVSQRKNNKKDLEVTIKGKTHRKREVKGEKGELLKVSVTNQAPLYDTPRLSSTVDYYNNEIRALNNCDTPYFAKDILRSHKAKKDRYTKYKKDYSLYFDGVHPNHELAKLWMCKILKFAQELNSASR